MAGRTRGANGTWVAQRTQTAKDEKTKELAGAETPLRPAQCRAYMRRRLAREFRGIVDGFIKGAKRGSCQHVKLATELVAPPVRTRPKRTGTVQRLLEELEGEGRG